MRKYLSFILFLCSPAYAQFFAFNGQCSKGGQAVVLQGLPSTGTKPLSGGTVANNTGVLGSYPSCSVLVYLTGTTTKATLFRDVAGSQALTNPFTANTDGSYLFFTASGQYDVLMSGGGLPTTVTLTQISLGAAGGGGGGGGGGGNVGTVNTVSKFVTPSTLGNSSIIDVPNQMTQVPSGVTVVNSGYGITYPNSPNGTTNNLLACIDLTVTTSSQVTTCATSTTRAIGIVQFGAGTTGNSQVVSSGFQTCIFDNQTIVGDAVVPSTTAAGQCSDAGAIRPPQTQGIGRVTTVNSGPGSSATVQMFSLDVSAPGSSTGNNGTVSNCGSGGVNAYYPAAGSVVQCDTTVTDDGNGNVTAKSVGTTDPSTAGYFFMKQGADPGVPSAGIVRRTVPVSVTAYEIIEAAAAGTGCIFGTNAANVVTLTFTPCAGSSYPVQVNGVGLTANDTINLNDSTPAAAANGLNVKFQTSKVSTTDSVSAYVPGDGNGAHYLSGAGTFTTPPGTGVTSVGATSPVASSGGTTPNISINNNGITSTQLAVVQTRRVCAIIIGADNATLALANADIAPQGRQCFIPYAATVVEVEVAADAGTPNVAPAKNHAGSLLDLVSSALATASAGGIACSNTGGTLGFDGVTTCSATLQNTSLAAGDYIETHTATAGGTAKRMSIFITYTVN